MSRDPFSSNHSSNSLDNRREAETRKTTRDGARLVNATKIKFELKARNARGGLESERGDSAESRENFKRSLSRVRINIGSERANTLTCGPRWNGNRNGTKNAKRNRKSSLDISAFVARPTTNSVSPSINRRLSDHRYLLGRASGRQ